MALKRSLRELKVRTIIGAGTPSEPSSKPFLSTTISRLTAIINARVPGDSCLRKWWSSGSTSSAHMSNGKTSDADTAAAEAEDDDEPPMTSSASSSVPPHSMDATGSMTANSAGASVRAWLEGWALALDEHIQGPWAGLRSASTACSSWLHAPATAAEMRSRRPEVACGDCSSSSASPSEICVRELPASEASEAMPSSSPLSMPSSPSSSPLSEAPSSTTTKRRTSCHSEVPSSNSTNASPVERRLHTRPAQRASCACGIKTVSPKRTSTCG
mmetsp:Transcript_60833/g.154591  ORF Transcript_60833/g.154591 Transcript_60833/m.154591 type:complete len:272 (+) Transcript_60833:947-1762(+)